MSTGNPFTGSAKVDAEKLENELVRGFQENGHEWVSARVAEAEEIARGAPARVRLAPDLPTMDLVAFSSLEPSPVAFAVKDLLPDAETTLLTAPGGGNKTTLSLMFATAMAARLDECLGLQISHAPAIYIGMEDSEVRLHWLLYHICRGLCVSMRDLAGRLHLVSMRSALHNGLGHFDSNGEFEPGQLYHQARELVEHTGARLLVLDNLAHLYTGNENDRGQVTRFLGALNKLASDAEVAVLLLAHTPKGGDNHSGSTAWVNAVRSHISIEKEDGGDPETRVLKVSKGNYVRPGEKAKFRWYDHYLIRPDDLPASIVSELQATSRNAAANSVFLKCLAAVTQQGRAVSHSGATNYAPRRFAKMPEARGYTFEELEGAMERLLHLGTILADQEVGRYANRTVRRGLKLVDEGAQSTHNRADEAHNQVHNPSPIGAQSALDPHNQAHNQPPFPTGMVDGALDPPSPSRGNTDDGWEPGDD